MPSKRVIDVCNKVYSEAIKNCWMHTEYLADAGSSEAENLLEDHSRLQNVLWAI